MISILNQYQTYHKRAVLSDEAVNKYLESDVKAKSHTLNIELKDHKLDLKFFIIK